MRDLKTMPRGVPTSKAGLLILVGSVAGPALLQLAKPAAKATLRGLCDLANKIKRETERRHGGPH